MVDRAPPTPPPTPRRWRGAGLAVAAVAALGGVFVLYRQPEFMVMLGNMIWACFG